MKNNNFSFQTKKRELLAIKLILNIIGTWKWRGGGLPLFVLFTVHYFIFVCGKSKVSYVTFSFFSLLS